MNETNQKALESAAIHKAISSKEFKAASANLEPGNYAVDMTVRIAGTINKGEPFEQRISNKINWLLLFSIAASKVNDETLACIIKAYDEAEGDKAKIDELTEAVKFKVQAHVDKQKGKTLTLKSGNVKSALTVKAVRVENGVVSKVG